MIKELINFTEKLQQDIPEISSWNINPSEGLHFFLKMNSDKSFQNFDYIYYTEKKEKNSDYTDEQLAQLENIKQYESNGRRIGTTMNKAFHKKIFACNPFIISFKKKTFAELSQEDFENFMNTAEEIAKLSEHEIKVSNLFLTECIRIKETEIKQLTQTTVIEDKKKGKTQKEEKLLSLLGKDQYIVFYLLCYPNNEGEVLDTDFSKYYSRYLNQKGFNQDKDEYKIGQLDINETSEFKFFTKIDDKQKSNIKKSFGISDYLNGLNSKKPYLEHKTAMFQNGISQYIDGDMAKALFKFEQLISVNRVLPNPLPIIIWNNDLKKSDNDVALEQDLFLREFKENIKSVKDKEIRIGFTEILKNIFEKNASFKLSNFYLFNFAGSKLRDFDFIEKFQYEIKNLVIKAIFNDDNNSLKDEKIENIFDFERKVVFEIFDRGLVSEFKLEETVNKVKTEHKSFIFKYFDDLKDSNYKGNMFLLVTKYRKAFYDYIYKSKQETLNASMIQDILSVGLLDDIRYDEFKNNKHSHKYRIYKKLNIWYSLYDYFLTNNKNEVMASKIDQFKNDFVEIIKGSRSLQDGEDELFAYTAGQVVHYIQSKTRSADKSYARLEPFLNKNGANEFKATLREEFAKYKHERYSNEFSNPFSQVNLYPLSKNMKDLLPFFLGGYFSTNLLFSGSINNN